MPLDKLKSIRLRSVLAVLSCLFLGVFTGYAADYDVIFRGGEVLDGTGASAIRADVGVRGGVIEAIGDLSEDSASRTIDISGLTLAPGFIDIHSHGDGAGEGGLRSRDPRRRGAPNMVSQGVTTLVVNQDGRSPFNIAQQRKTLEERGFGPNVALMVGHNTVRRTVMLGNYKRPATAEEVEQMTALVVEGMEAGAHGFTAGLEYIPGIWSTTEELIALVRAIRPYGGTYIVHERSSGQDPMWYVPSHDDPDQPTMLDNIHEQIEVARTTGVTTVATHIKARGTSYWGKSVEIVDAIQRARDDGVPIFADHYPYTTSGSDGTIALLPGWVDGYRDKDNAEKDFGLALARALAKESSSADLRKDVAHQIERRGGPERIVIFDHPTTEYIGKSLADLARLKEVTPVEAAFLLQFEGFRDRFGGARLRGFSMAESDVETFARQPWMITASDAGIALPFDSPVHARFYGTFPRKIAQLVRERGTISLEHAIRSMTSLPAEVMGFSHRGRVAKGYAADLTVLDVERVVDRATFFNPHRYAEGVKYVMVNGELLIDNGRFTMKMAGRILTPEGPRGDSD